MSGTYLIRDLIVCRRANVVEPFDDDMWGRVCDRRLPNAEQHPIRWGLLGGREGVGLNDDVQGISFYYHCHRLSSYVFLCVNASLLRLGCVQSHQHNVTDSKQFTRQTARKSTHAFTEKTNITRVLGNTSVYFL